MTDPEYVLCRWKKRLWPAKVLSKIVPSTRSGKTASFDVEILGVGVQTKITCTDPEPLERERIQIIGSELGDRKEKPTDELEEVKYRCALKIALNILDGEATSKQVGLSNEGPITQSAQKEIKTVLVLLPDSTSGQVPLPKELKGHQTLKKEEQKKQSLQTNPKPPKSKLSLSSEEGAKPCRNNTRSSVSKSKDLSNARKSESQNHKASKSKVKTTLKNQEKVNSKLSKAVRSSSPTREENVKTKEGRKRSREVCEPSSPITRLQVSAFFGQSTPVSANYSSAITTAFGKKANGKKRSGRRLLNTVECLSTELQSEVSEESEASGRKSRTLERSKKLVNSRPVVWKRTSNAAASPCRKRRCRSCPEPLCKASNPRKLPDRSRWPREEKNKSNLRAKNIELPDFQEDEELEASDLFSKHSSSENSHLVSNLVDEEEDEDEELPSFLLHQEPSSIEPGMLVWCKLPRYPYWPAVVKRVSRKPKKATVLLIEGNVNFEKPKGFSIRLRNLKHFDCEEKQKLIDQAKENYSHEVEWCIELISDYRIRVGCHSFTGSFLEYLADDISYPVRKEVNQNVVQMTFPHVAEEDLEESVLESPSDRPSKKVLPDRKRAARDKANEKIVEFIVKTKGAEEHLQAILKSQKQSRWLKEFFNSSHYVTCVETYLEDEGQLDLVVNYLRKVYHETDARNLDLVNGDKIKFILDVLLPEAIIFAISAVDDIDYKKAEEKYIKGPSVSKRCWKHSADFIVSRVRRDLSRSSSPTPCRGRKEYWGQKTPAGCASNLLLNTPRVEACTTSLGSWFQTLAALTVK